MTARSMKKIIISVIWLFSEYWNMLKIEYWILICSTIFFAFNIFFLKMGEEMRPILAFDLTNFTDSCINVTKAELAAGFSGATNHLTYIFVWHVTLTIIIITIQATKIVQVAIRKYASKCKNILRRACHSLMYISIWRKMMTLVLK